MNRILAVPIEWRLAAAWVVGACLGALANWAAVRFAWEPHGINPWIADPQAIGRRWWDRVPIAGWLFLRDQRSRLYGWVRPLLVELFAATGVAALYWWEVGRGALLPAGAPPALLPALATPLHAQWFCHTVLAWLMLAASLIDADEKLIPDEITVPGTLFGLSAAALYPFAMLPVASFQANHRVTLGFLQVFSPHEWPRWLDGFPHGGSLAIALGLWWLWCVALMDRPWYTSWGWYRAIQLLCARLTRSPSARPLSMLGLIGSAVILGVWLWGGPPHWTGLLSGLIGMAAGGGLIWMVRIMGTAILQREAMGFGDVTLMAMIGSLLGWQSCMVIFFLAPFAGLILGLVQLILRRENEIPYGPFLCLATVVLIVGWRCIWNWLEPTLFILGGLVPLFLVVVCLGAMPLLLGLWRLVRASFQ